MSAAAPKLVTPEPPPLLSFSGTSVPRRDLIILLDTSRRLTPLLPRISSVGIDSAYLIYLLSIVAAFSCGSAQLSLRLRNRQSCDRLSTWMENGTLFNVVSGETARIFPPLG